MPQNPIPFVVIYADAPEILLFELSYGCNAAFLVIRRTLPAALRQYDYLIEDVYRYRKELEDTGVPPSSILYRSYRDGDWPDDLTEVPGLWQYPLRITFPNLTFLDLSIQDATLWLMPILDATDSGALRRVFIRSCADWDDQVLPFPFEALDRQLSFRPAAKLLIGWAYGHDECDSFINVFRSNLPCLTVSGRLGILSGRGPNAVLPQINLDNHPEFWVTDDDGESHPNPYADGFVNEYSWEYDPDKDPLGPISVS